jgi:hypothetical protein
VIGVVAGDIQQPGHSAGASNAARRQPGVTKAIEKEQVMAHSLVIEEESGTCRGWVHPHNGYYAGNFSTARQTGPGRAADAPVHLHVVVAPPAGTVNSTAMLAAGPQAA